MSWITPSWMLDPRNEYYIEFTNGTRTTFYAPDKKAALRRFMNEGDHAYTWGNVLEENTNDYRER